MRLSLVVSSLCLFLGALPTARAAAYCDAWSDYLVDVKPGLLTKFAPVQVKGDPEASRYHGSLKKTHTRDIACDSSNGCAFAGETTSLTGGMKVSNELITVLPRDFSKTMKRFTEKVNAYRDYAKKKKESSLLDAKQKKLLEEIALTALKGREIVVNDGLAKGCFSAYEKSLNAKTTVQRVEVRKMAAQIEGSTGRMPASAAPATAAPTTTAPGAAEAKDNAPEPEAPPATK